MDAREIETDYLIIGAGALGMAFADTLLAESDARLVIVDRRHRPGGHWNDAYPFVRLHQPSANYGVNSRALGSGEKDAAGLNAGLYELASGAEVVSYFDQVMRRTFLPTGRVQYFPMSEHIGDGAITSLLSGERRNVSARKVVDARYLEPSVPSTRPPAFAVAAGMTCAPPNDVPRLAASYADHVVIGAGKTGMDACLWLLENGADPDRIRWIMPRDAWLVDRINFQPGDEMAATSLSGVADQAEALAQAESLEDLFARLESSGALLRLDPAVKPAAYHCATVTKAEVEQLRRIRNIVRLGRVQGIEADRIVLRDGTIPTTANTLHIDCSASALNRSPVVPVFDDARITLQCVRQCQPAFSAALIGHVEATRHDETEKNKLCTPVPLPDRDTDWLAMIAIDLGNRFRWSQDAEIAGWMAASRLEGFAERMRRMLPVDSHLQAQMQRYASNVGPAAAKAKALLASLG